MRAGLLQDLRFEDRNTRQTQELRFKAMEEFGFGPNVMKNTKVCSQCGQAVNADTAYCSGCGAKLRQMTADFPA